MRGTKLLFDIIGISLIEQFPERCFVRQWKLLIKDLFSMISKND